MVRRLPHAVLRPARPGHGHLRRLGQDRPELLRRAQERLDRARRQAVLRAVLQLPVGALLPQERVREGRLRGPGDARRPQGARDEDEERRPGADRLRRQGRLAGDGDLRHPQPAHQRLRLPHAAHEGRGELAGPEGRQGLRHLGRAAAVPPAGRARPHLAGGGEGPLGQEVRHVPARDVRRPAVLRGRPRGPRLLRLPGDRLQHRRRHARRADRRLHALQGPGERGGREGPARVPRRRRGAEHLPGGRPEQHRHQQERRHQRLQRAAEEGRRARVERVEHHPVHGPRHAARTSPRR